MTRVILTFKLWAVLAFPLNVIPFIGAFLMAAPAVLVARVQTDLGTSLLVALGYLVVNTGIGSILDARDNGPRTRHLQGPKATPYGHSRRNPKCPQCGVSGR